MLSKPIKFVTKGALVLSVATIFAGASVGVASACSADEYKEASHTSYSQDWNEASWQHDSDKQASHDEQSWNHEDSWKDDGSSHDENWDENWDDNDNWSHNSSKEHESWKSDDSSHHDDWSHDDQDWSNDEHASNGSYSNGGHHDSDAQYANSDDEWNDDGNYDENYLKLDAALREHAPTGVDSLRAQFLGSPDLPAIQDVVNMNSNQIADLVDGLYPGTRDEFLSLWETHLHHYKQYLEATVDWDEAGREEAKSGLVDFTYDLSYLLENAGDNLSAEELQPHLAVHGDQVLMIIDSFAEGDYDKAWQLNHEAYEHMGMLAKLLYEGAADRNHSYHGSGYGHEYSWNHES